MSNKPVITLQARSPYQKIKRTLYLLWAQKPLIALCLPALVLLIIFQYGPMYGVLIAFKKFKASKGVMGSPWLDPWYANFKEFFSNVNSWKIIMQTIKVGFYTFIFTYPMPILLALLLNELKSKWFKRSVQSISYLPHFISIVVICSMLNTFGSISGLFNQIRAIFGLAAVNMNSGTIYFLPMYIGSAIWQNVGWSSIIYMAALANVDTSLYDVANIDGANRFQKILHICLPAILPTTTILLILNVGNVLQQDFTKILLMQNDSNRMDLDVISTYVYRMGIVQGQFSFATAVNLLVSVVSLVFVYTTNKITQKISPDNSMW